MTTVPCSLNLRPTLRPLAACLALALAGGSLAAPVPIPPGSLPGMHARAAATPAAREGRRARKPAAHRLAPARPAAPGNTWSVENCDDDGSPETLRSVIAAAASGDIIDLSALTCSTITLSSGAIRVDVDDLDIEGPGTGLAVDGAGSDSVFLHYGQGTLGLRRLTIANGSFDGGGGCIFSQASVALDQVVVRDCQGGSEYGAGGGVLALGDLTIDSSTLSGNRAFAGGAAVADGAVEIRNSTLSGNGASHFGGALYHGGEGAGGATLTILNSTITDNHADYAGGGMYIGYDPAITIESSVIAGNSASYVNDLAAGDPLTVAGNHNLVGSSSLILPGDTLDGDPLLGPLADNGGPTPTHAPLAGSPLIDAGSNPANLGFDQRGDGHPRVLGEAADIGAIESDATEDTIFRDDFEAG